MSANDTLAFSNHPAVLSDGNKNQTFTQQILYNEIA